MADQLSQVDDNLMVAFASFGYPMNTLNTLFDKYEWSSGMATPTGLTQIYKWNGNGFDEQIDENAQQLAGWFDEAEGTPSGDMTMLPGTPVIMNNPTGEPYTIWFTGLVRPEQIFQIAASTNGSPTTNYLSATAPISGAISSITGYNPSSGDIIQLWNSTSNKFVAHTNLSGSWSNGGLPALNVGEGFILISTNAYTWTNTWETGVCGSP